MNAAVAQRAPLTTILQHTHTVSVCLSKVGGKERSADPFVEQVQFRLLC